MALYWGMVGLLSIVYNTALNYSKERKQFSKPIAGYQLTQAKLADMVTQITESQLMVYRLGRLKDEGKNEISAGINGKKK